jgi:hypothetical protein
MPPHPAVFAPAPFARHCVPIHLPPMAPLLGPGSSLCGPRLLCALVCLLLLPACFFPLNNCRSRANHTHHFFLFSAPLPMSQPVPSCCRPHAACRTPGSPQNADLSMVRQPSAHCTPDSGRPCVLPIPSPPSILPAALHSPRLLLLAACAICYSFLAPEPRMFRFESNFATASRPASCRFLAA